MDALLNAACSLDAPGHGNFADQYRLLNAGIAKSTTRTRRATNAAPLALTLDIPHVQAVAAACWPTLVRAWKR